MNVYKKLTEARCKFHALKLEKTGHNKFAGYKYFELSDFLVPALQVFRDVGLCSVVSFDASEARMQIFDVDNPESSILITSPLGSAQLKGAHEIQNIGAVETYQRRYLWVAALEIVEHDAIDSAQMDAKPAKQEPVKPETIGGRKTSELDEIGAYLVECHQSGKDLDAIKIWYAADTWTGDNGDQQEQKLYLWGELKAYSKLRSAIKANKQE